MRRGLPTAAVLLVLVAAACAPIAQETAPPAGDTTSTTGTPAPPTAASLANASIKLTQVTTTPAITMAARPNDPNIYIGTFDGHVYRVSPKGRLSLALDISNRVFCCDERGLLGMAFNGVGDKLYLHFSKLPAGDTEVDEFAFANGQALPSPTNPIPRTVFTATQPQANHNGGSLLWGPGGYLYLALGDGGGGCDGAPNYLASNHQDGGNAQSLTGNFLGKIIRIDPTDPDIDSDMPEYTIPPSNPFVGSPGLDEIWSYGLRNPFRMSFDRATGDLWVGDVGQASQEEIDFVPASHATHPSGKGANFGWNRFEGTVANPCGDARPPTGASPLGPQLAVGRSQGDRAIVGGYVYRGTKIPDLAGAYLFADYYHSSIRAICLNVNGCVIAGNFRDFGIGVADTASFGEDNNGELYVLSLSQGVFRIDPADPPIQRGLP